MFRTFCSALIFGLILQTSIIADAQPAECAVVEEALRASTALKPGMNRADVERAFETDGGMNFRGKTIYVFKKCHYIKIDVEFTIDSKVENELAATDTVKSVSRMYVEYPHAD